MSAAANALRGEGELRIGGATHVLRPSFGALVERAADGRLALGEMATLFWHCIAERPAALTREAVGEAVVAAGLAGATPALRLLLGQILQGR